MARLHNAVVYVAATAALVLGCKGAEKASTSSTIPETNDKLTTAQINGYVYKPALIPANDQQIAQLKVPAGFTVTKFAKDLGKPRMLAVHTNGDIYVTDREAGTVTLVRDTNQDGKADEKRKVLTLKQVHGITIHQGTLYLVTVKEVYSAPMQGDGTLGQPKKLIDDLPDGGQHANRTIAFGPNGMMYLTVGSTCNACQETSPESATILRANADGTNRKIYAKGLRNTIGFGWHPQSQELYGLDHGIDWLGNNEQREEVNAIKQDADYGWPYIYGEGKYNPADRPPGDTTYQQYLRKTTLPLLTYDAHSAPLGFAFYTGSQFPAGYQNDAFVALRGSWNRSSPTGYKVVRLRFVNGKPTRFEDFLTGFLTDNNRSMFGRPVGIAQHQDGSLLLTDDNNGVMYRVAYSQ
ncbi:PQQ-dependent sugar dehydrogenase [Telluribacter humicola]|uniref:PQQ-dependent sugar dehydrogenase n=1 Tax=Telluribacter humicola TaxID=1720261 RepID=UPI001A97BC25|nr:sorbosone dehydrogenase family protein [Telluribacter humicola]